MGLGIVLIFWMLLGGVLTVVAAAILAAITFLLTRGASTGRRRVLLFAVALPFLSAAWVGAIFGAFALVNTLERGRDIGIGDAWYT
ncbi:MAG TPA: hypothetical protein VHL34_07205, partial [Rhizomicrobium sp.]|nr:hypothetical protein [Rhizomicrobium sp.]